MSAPETARDMGRCPCGVSLIPEGFRDHPSFLDARITGLCQGCQDRVYLAHDPEDGRRHPIVDGALLSVNPGASVDQIDEVVLLPFRLVVPGPGPGRAKLVWESTDLTRAGPCLAPVDRIYELHPMAGLLLDHQVCLSELPAFDAPELTARLATLSFLVGLDQPSLDAAAAVCHFPEGIAMAALDTCVPWHGTFGRALRPLETWTGPEAHPLSALRVLAVLGMLLMEHGRGLFRPLDHLVAGPAYAPVVQRLVEQP